MEYRAPQDETYAKVAGRWRYLYRAIDQYGQIVDVLVSEKRDLAATRRFSPGRSSMVHFRPR
ncbi:MAG: DDE-type integrase/transposase/recombinase [Pseudonocardiales bacterium]|nr:DDE-type integrase/transposase/recombinase [Pseudonocardiales bacterium]